jgi:hypothetical protein
MEEKRECRRCAYFADDPAEIGALVAGLPSLGSGHATVRADDGLCLKHGRYLGARCSCADFERA